MNRFNIVAFAGGMALSFLGAGWSRSFLRSQDCPPQPGCDPPLAAADCNLPLGGNRCEPTFKLLPPEAVVSGMTLTELGSEWWKWVLSVPTERNPLIDPCGKFCHQEQPVEGIFFLTGSTGAPIPCRKCTIPCNQRILVPLLNVFWSAEGDCEDMRDRCKDDIDKNIRTNGLPRCTIDGVEVPPEEILSRRKIQSPDCYELEVAHCNIYNSLPGVYSPTADDGFYLVLEPLCPGDHVIEWGVTYRITVEECLPFLRGDSNGDGAVDLSDAVAILGFLFLGDPLALLCEDAADADDLGKVLDITDAIFILSYLFLGTEPPPAPGPKSCGSDPTPDDSLDCKSPPVCPN